MVIDTPAGAVEDVAEAIVLADLAVMVVRPTLLDLAALARTLNIVRQLRKAAIVVVNQAPVPREGVEAPLVKRALRALEFAGDLHVANDAERALDLLGDRRARIDLVLLDLDMPRRSGHELLHDLRGRPHPPVVVLTSSTDPADRRRCFHAAAAGYFVKSLDTQVLQRTLDTILAYWRRSERPPLPLGP